MYACMYGMEKIGASFLSSVDFNIVRVVSFF